MMQRRTVAYLREALKAAKDLEYGNEVISKLKVARTDVEIEHIMRTAREAWK